MEYDPYLEQYLSHASPEWQANIRPIDPQTLHTLRDRFDQYLRDFPNDPMNRPGVTITRTIPSIEHHQDQSGILFEFHASGPGIDSTMLIKDADVVRHGWDDPMQAEQMPSWLLLGSRAADGMGSMGGYTNWHRDPFTVAVNLEDQIDDVSDMAELAMDLWCNAIGATVNDQVRQFPIMLDKSDAHVVFTTPGGPEQGVRVDNTRIPYKTPITMNDETPRTPTPIYAYNQTSAILHVMDGTQIHGHDVAIRPDQDNPDQIGITIDGRKPDWAASNDADAQTLAELDTLLAQQWHHDGDIANESIGVCAGRTATGHPMVALNGSWGLWSNLADNVCMMVPLDDASSVTQVMHATGEENMEHMYSPEGVPMPNGSWHHDKVDTTWKDSRRQAREQVEQFTQVLDRHIVKEEQAGRLMRAPEPSEIVEQVADRMRAKVAALTPADHDGVQHAR